ncbi:hypothetical protein L7F22_041233 [Adiantum nelumboides]|nr:hypothetical protein [Adiantum nelumboides]
MPFKGLIREFQDMKDGIGSISRRSFEIKFPIHHHRSRSMNSVIFDAQRDHNAGISGQSCWANMPPELLRDVLQRVEASESSWPARKHFVACACVCRNWREVAKEFVKVLEHSARITFPISLKQVQVFSLLWLSLSDTYKCDERFDSIKRHVQMKVLCILPPGPRNSAMQCYIKRDRNNSTYHLFLGTNASLGESGKFLLAARKVRHAASADYVISLSADDMSRGSNTYVGKLRSNFIGTKFTVYDSQPPHSGAITSTKKAGRRVGSKQIMPRLPAGSYNVAHIAYELNVLGSKGPRRMHCTMHSIPVSAMDTGGNAPTPVEFSAFDCSLSSLPSFGSTKSSHFDFSNVDAEAARGGFAPLMLKNKAPRWHEQLQCWCLNFRGRVTVASVKNFQLVAANTSEPTQPPRSSQNDYDKVLLQFGKVGKDMFTMDYRYPLSAFQAFAICLSTFDTKLACE